MAIKNTADIETALKLKPGALKAAIDATDEVEIPVANLVIRTTDENTTREENLKRAHEEAGAEIAVKAAKQKFGLDFQGKTIENFADAFKAKVIAEANLPKDKRVTELESDLTGLRTNLDVATNKIKELETTITVGAQQRTIESQILAKIPENTTIPRNDVFDLFASRNKARLNDKGQIEFLDGDQVRKNPATMSPLTVDEVMGTWITPYLKTASGGAGGSDDPAPGKPGTMEHFIKKMEDQGIKQGSEKFNTAMVAAYKAGELKY